MRQFIFIALAVALFACKARKIYQLKDTEGRTFSANCEGSRKDTVDCTYAIASTATAKPAGTAPSGAHAGFALDSGDHRYLAVCEGWLSEPDLSAHTFVGGRCRIVTCAKDTDCPVTDRLPQPKCVNGLCADPARAIDATT